MALIACPTASIGTSDKRGAAGAVHVFPQLVNGNVFYCGFASEASFGASSYFIERAGGHVLVDSPRAAAPLIKQLEQRGGVSIMFLSHQDDVADHAKFHARFGCQRVLHEADAGPETSSLELLW